MRLFAAPYAAPLEWGIFAAPKRTTFYKNCQKCIRNEGKVQIDSSDKRQNLQISEIIFNFGAYGADMIAAP